MQSPGKQFESNWKESYKNTDLTEIRLKDSAKWLMGQTASFQTENPCDFIMYFPFLWTLELKSTEGASMSFNPKEPWKKPANENTHVMIKHSQVKSLLKFAEKDGVIPGFIMNFRERFLKTKSEPNEVFFVHIEDFIDFAVSNDKSTISRKDCRRIGIEIKAHRKKVNYVYDITKFAKDSIEYCLNKDLLGNNILQKILNYLPKQDDY